MLQRYDYILPEIALIALALYCAVSGAGILRTPDLAPAGNNAPAPVALIASPSGRSAAAPNTPTPLSAPATTTTITVNAPGNRVPYLLDGAAIAGLAELRTALQAGLTAGKPREALLRLQGGEASFARLRPLAEMLVELQISFRSEEAK